MWWRAIIAGLGVAGVSELADRYPRLSVLLLTLPIVSIIAFIAVWTKDHNLDVTTRLARERSYSCRLISHFRAACFFSSA